MKRTAIMLGTGTVAVAALLSGLAYGDPLDDAIPAVPAVPGVPTVPDANGLVATVAETLAGAGLPVETPALPAVPTPAAVVATVQETLAGTGISLPTQDPVLAVPENIVVGNLNEAVERAPLYLSAVPGVAEVTATTEETVTTAVATAQDTVAGLGLPLDAPALPALPTVPDATALLGAVQETVAGLGLPLGGLLPGF